ncbi:Rv3717 family N-acetylmuramoyl-L-alanine amidase [Mycolicibacterium insubricum]|uniref:N-acetylmuramoyl-L-alanine amidase n=1 Tax=Mycolicibacterium insubricum TaxID=444597 RepID=A0A1X0CYI3_9MYCO|nr:N-acetylmuramoyl-L-alanine amidase [Mycolicibacterium insubricum]
MAPVHLRTRPRVGAVLATALLTAAATMTPSTAPDADAAPASIAGMIVFLDPGHNANNEGNSVQVPTGRGGTKDCQASGTSTDDGYPEHTFTWDTTLRVRQLLTQYGVRTAMSRGDDASHGPCVDARAAMANSVHPNAIVSIHADGGPATGRGFHVLYSSPPLNQVQAGPAVVLAKTVRDQMQASGLTPATYIGSGGLMGRSDIAGLNLAQYPSVLVECGNMKNPADSALMKTEAGRQKYAEAIVRGIATYLVAQNRAG